MIWKRAKIGSDGIYHENMIHVVLEPYKVSYGHNELMNVLLSGKVLIGRSISRNLGTN